MAAKPKTSKPRTRAPKPSPVETDTPRIDGRSLRRTGRTVQLATRITPEFDQQLREAAARDGKLIVQLLEEGFALYEARSKNRHGRRGPGRA